jgi:dihydrofolate reductase
VTIAKRNVVAFEKKLKGKPGRKIWLLRGSEIVKLLIGGGLVDKIVHSIHPILIGKGIPLFLPQAKRVRYKLLNSESYPSRLVQFSYRRME